MNDSIHIVEIEIPSSLNADLVLDEIKKEEEEEEYEDLILSGVGNVSKDCSKNELHEWNECLLKWRKNTFHKKPRGIELLIRKGIPEALRCEVWQLLAGCNKNEENISESYAILLSKESPNEQLILNDVDRTFNGNEFFKDKNGNGQQLLYNVAKAYSIYDKDVGYCQGMMFLIASLLLHMPEEQAFNLLIKIMYTYKMRELFKLNFESLQLRLYQLECLIKKHLPQLNDHFENLDIKAHMYASQWFLTLFTAKFPLYMVFRILDLVLSEGFIVIFSMSIALLKRSETDLLNLNFEEILKYLTFNLPKMYKFEGNLNFQELLQEWSQFQTKIDEKKLLKYEKNFNLMKLNGNKSDSILDDNDDDKKSFSKQTKELEDVKNELALTKSKLKESLEKNKKLTDELNQLKLKFNSYSKSTFFISDDNYLENQ